MSKIIHYRKDCIGCYACVEQQQEHWEINPKDGKAILKNAVLKKNIFIKEIHVSEREKTQQVVRDCPVRIIKLVDSKST